MSGSTRIEFKARDGVTLRGDFFKAEGGNAANPKCDLNL